MHVLFPVVQSARLQLGCLLLLLEVFRCVMFWQIMFMVTVRTVVIRFWFTLRQVRLWISAYRLQIQFLLNFSKVLMFALNCVCCYIVPYAAISYRMLLYRVSGLYKICAKKRSHDHPAFCGNQFFPGVEGGCACKISAVTHFILMNLTKLPVHTWLILTGKEFLYLNIFFRDFWFDQPFYCFKKMKH